MGDYVKAIHFLYHGSPVLLVPQEYDVQQIK